MSRGLKNSCFNTKKIDVQICVRIRPKFGPKRFEFGKCIGFSMYKDIKVIKGSCAWCFLFLNSQIKYKKSCVTFHGLGPFIHTVTVSF